MTRIIITALVGCALSGLLGFLLLPVLRALKAGQSIREIGPTWHNYKAGTPMMGGLMFIGAALICLLVLGAAVLAGAAFDGLTWRYFPTVKWSTTPLSFGVLAAYTALCALPLILNWKEDRKWNALRSKI